MAVTFTPKVEWPDNPLRLQAADYGIKVPAGLSNVDIREPNYVDVTTMGTKSKEHAVGTGSALSIVNGLVTRDLVVTFANPEQQWRELSGSKSGPGQFQFQGGEIVLGLQLAMYVIQHVKPDPKDKYSKQIFAEVYSHELLHVDDEITLVESLPDELKSDGDISRLLTQPFNYGTSRQTMAAAAEEFREYVRKRLAGLIMSDHWAPKTNAAARRRDSPEEYRKVQDRIDTLRAQQINR